MEHYVVLCDWMKHYQPYKVSKINILSFFSIGLHKVFMQKSIGIINKNKFTVFWVTFPFHSLQWEETASFLTFLKTSVPLTPPNFEFPINLICVPNSKHSHSHIESKVCDCTSQTECKIIWPIYRLAC